MKKRRRKDLQNTVNTKQTMVLQIYLVGIIYNEWAEKSNKFKTTKYSDSHKLQLKK